MRNLVWKSVLLALLLGAVVIYGQPASAGSPNDRLFSRIYGCEAAVTIANAMGASVEGWPYERIEQTYGFLDRFLPEEQRESTRPVRFGPKFEYHAYLRQPGWGEDGMERYRLLTSAILKKGGRVNIEDVTREWIENVDPARFGYNVGPQDQVIYYLLKAGLPPWEVGRWALWPGFMGTSKMIMPIGMVNAGRPDNAARDALDIVRFKDVQGRPLWRDDTGTISRVSSVVYDYGLENAAAIAAATAEALRPDATVNSVIDAALAQLPQGARAEVELSLDYARKVKDWREFRPFYQRLYQGKPVSAAIEVLSGGLACFLMADGRPREAILYAVNLGRDTDCKAYVAGGLAGALRGIEAVPPEWVATVERAVLTDPHTVSRRTARQAAEGIYRACVNELRKSETAVNEIESLIAK
jgi:ADP-ribosylglycohydrolase